MKNVLLLKLFFNFTRLHEYVSRDKSKSWSLWNERRKLRLISDVKKFLSPAPTAGPLIGEKAIPFTRDNKKWKAQILVVGEDP